MIESSLFNRMIAQHFTTLLLIVVYAIKLSDQKKAKDAELRYFWMTLICCLLLVLEDVCESLCAMNPALRLPRIVFSIIGYTLRPVAAIGLLLVVCPPERRNWKLWIPAIINLLVFLTAFFSPVAFSFDSEYAFVRGPLGYSVFVVALLYMVQILFATWRRFYDRKKSERYLLIICAASCIAASVIDALNGGSRLNEAIMISSVFFYIFLRSHDNRRDPLTGLENRFSFYGDMEDQQKAITAVASLDMNGLKHINDTRGHAEGDRVLTSIGRCLNRVNSRNTIVYRIGGDEFAMLFLHQGEADVAQAIRQVKEDVVRAGFSLSAGYAMRENGERVEDALIRSDRNMYSDKAEYYRQSGMERRSH